MAKSNYYLVYQVRDEYGFDLKKKKLVFNGRAKDVQEFLGVKTHPAEIYKRGNITKMMYQVEIDGKDEEAYTPPDKFREIDIQGEWGKAVKHARLYLSNSNYRKHFDDFNRKLLEKELSNEEMQAEWEKEKERVWATQ